MSYINNIGNKIADQIDSTVKDIKKAVSTVKNTDQNKSNFKESDKVSVSQSDSGKAVENFYIYEENVCRVGDDPNKSLPAADNGMLVSTMQKSAQKASETIAQKIAEVTSVIQFSGGNATGNIKADLNIDVVDKNGFLDYGDQDLNVTLNGDINVKKDVFAGSLKSVENMKIKKSFLLDVNIGKIQFDPKDRSYKIQVKVDPIGPLNDTITLVVKTDNNNRLTMGVEDKWIPDFIKSDKDVLNIIKTEVMKKLKDSKFGLDMKLEGGQLYFMPEIKPQEIKINDKNSLRIDKSNISPENTKFKIDHEGNVNIGLKNVTVTASEMGKDNNEQRIAEKSAGDPDSVNLNVSADINTRGDKEIVVKGGKISANLDAKESELIKIKGSSLNNHFSDINASITDLDAKVTIDKSNKVTSNVKGNVSVSLERPTSEKIGLQGSIGGQVDSKGQFKVGSNDLTISHSNGQSHVSELLIAKDEDGLQMHIKDDMDNLPPLNLKTTKNSIKPIIGAADSFKLLCDKVKSAKESINIESYLYSGDTAQTLADMLLLKSAGLDDTKGKLKLTNSAGVKVKMIFDSGLGDKTQETHESSIMLQDKLDKFIKNIKEGNGSFAILSPQEKEKAIKNVEENMQWKVLKGGITKIDHRKVSVIDGQTAVTGGGVNLTDSAMRKHDMMLDVWGPAVNQIQTEFLQNWEEVAGKISDAEKKKLIKDDKTLNRIMQTNAKIGSAPVKTQILVTDDNQFQSYQKMVELIRGAKSEINIEHAYFTDKKLADEVCDAIKRGIKVNVVLPEESDEGDTIHYGNLGTLQKLKKASEQEGAGELNAYLFRKDKKFNHTKAMSFDGQTAIVGSTNLTTRSLRGTVTGFLFNREMSVLVDDKNFVKNFNDSLFKNDTKSDNAIKLTDEWFKDLEKEQKKIDKYTAIQPLF